MMQITIRRWHVFAIIAALFVALLALPAIAWAQGFTDCGSLGWGWEPTWTNGEPYCTSHGVFDNGCCYRADGNDTLAVIAIGVLPFALFGFVLGLFRAWLEGRWINRQLGLDD